MSRLSSAFTRLIRALSAGLLLNVAAAVLSGAPAHAQTIESPASPYQIRKIQEMLTALGHDPGPADGIPGARTTAAVAAFQQQEGLAQTGRMDVALFRALAARAGAIQSERPAASDSTAAAAPDSTQDGGAAASSAAPAAAEIVAPVVAPVAAPAVAPAVGPAVNPALLPGTRWEIVDADGARQTVRFGVGGAMADALMPRFWKWRIDGAHIVLEFDNEAGGRVRRVGRFTGPATIAGTAESSRGRSWVWTASRR